MSEGKPNYYAIIPADIRYDSELSDKAKLFYGEITCLANSSGICFAGNAYFAELYGISARQIERILKCLEKRGYIQVNIIKNTKRVIKLTTSITLKETSSEIGTTKMSQGYDKNVGGRYDKNVAHNNTSINTKNNNIYTAEFDLWWEKYPKKVGKQQAYKNYCYWIKKGYTHKDLIAARDNYIREVQNMNTELQYIKKPSNFLGRNNFFVDYISVEQEPIAKAAVVHGPIKNAISEIFKEEWYDR